MYTYKKITDLDQFHKIADFSFRLDKRYRTPVRHAVQNSLKLGSEAWGAYDSSTLAAGFVLDEYTMRFRGSMVKMGGIGFVCTRIDYRGRGAVKFLLKESLKTMRERGFAVSALYPFNQEFYRKYGWEQFYRARRIKLAPGNIKLPEDDDKITAELLYLPDESAVQYYNSYAQQNYNYCLRTREFWTMAMSNTWPDMIARHLIKFKGNGETVGLMDLAYVKDDEEKKSVLWIRPLIYSSERVRRSMLAFVKRLSQQIDEVVFSIPMDEELWPYLSDRPKEQTIEDLGMIRIVSIERLDGIMIDSPDLEVGVKLDDKLGPWNNGVFSLKVQSGKLRVVPDDKYDFECDVATLSSVLSGFTDLKAMLTCNKIKTTGKDLENDFPKETTLLTEFF